MEDIRPAVVVGVDGSVRDRPAVGYAVAEAERARASLRLVHVAPDYWPTTPMLPLIRDDFVRTGQRILADAQGVALDGASRRVGSDGVTRVLRAGPTVDTLLREATGAALVVLGRPHHRGEGAGVAAFTASATVGVAARATCPVVSVPATWSGGTPHGRVVVGVRVPEESEALLEHAYAAAEALEDRLIVVHAWTFPERYDEIVAARSHPGDLDRLLEERIDPALDGPRRRHPGVEDQLAVLHERPARALARIAAASDLLVLARRRRTAPVGHHLGGTARHLVREAACPVEVLPA